MSDETSAAIADDTKLVAGIIREAKDGFGHIGAVGCADRDDAQLVRDYPVVAAAVRIALAGRAAASSDLDAIKREAAREALTYVRDQFEMRPALPREIALAVVDMALRNRYPAPVPEPPHVMVNGWRVTWDGREFWATDTEGKGFAKDCAVRLCTFCSREGEEDIDVVRVLALREGRGGDGKA